MAIVIVDDEPRAAVVRSTARNIPDDGHAARIVKARPVRLTPKMTVEEAFRVTVLECLAQVSANTPAILQAREVEGLHQMRVGLRRLHVALFAFGEEFRTPTLKELRKRTKAFTDAIAPARDMDVFIEEHLSEPESVAGSSDAFALLRQRAETARREAWDKAAEHVSGAEFSAFLDDVAAAAETHSWFKHAVTPSPYGNHFVASARVRPTAERMLDEHYMRVAKRGRHMKALDEHDRHRLHIALKKLRYAAEFFGPLYKEKRVRRYLKRVKSLLDDLGALNDVVGVRATLTRLLHEDGSRRPNADLYFAAGLVAGWHNARAERFGKDAIAGWETFKHLDPFWR